MFRWLVVIIKGSFLLGVIVKCFFLERYIEWVLLVNCVGYRNMDFEFRVMIELFGNVICFCFFLGMIYFIKWIFCV